MQPHSAHHVLIFAVVSLFASTALPACGKNDETEAATLLGVTVTEKDRADATEIFNTRCSVCHGASGGGDGAASATLVPKPRNFHDKAWQTSVSNEHITKIIRFGGPAVGKAPTMPANPDLVDRGAVVAALTGKIRAFGK